MDGVWNYKSIFFCLCIIIASNANAADSTSISKFISVSIYTLANDDNSCVIPFNRVGNLIVLKAKADTTEGNFILDTGAPGLVLNLTYFRNYSITSHQDGEQASI